MKEKRVKKENKLGKVMKLAGSKVLSTPKKAVKAVGKAGKVAGKTCGDVAVRTVFKIYTTI